MANVRDTASAVKPWLVYGYRKVEPLKARSDRKRLDLLVKLLGNNAARVWCALLGLRDPDTGLAHPSIPGLSRRLGISPRTINRAFRRLSEAGLVYSHGKKRIERARRRVWTRFVWGHVHGGYVWVPKWTKKWVERSKPAPGWGGKRDGAGRYPKVSDKKPFRPMTTGTKQSSGAPIEEDLDLKSSYTPSGYTQPSRATREVKTFLPKPKGLISKDPGYRFGPHCCRWDWYQRLVQDGVIPRLRFGKRREVPWVQIPLPEKLDPSRSPEDNAWILATTYRNFATRRGKKRSYAFSKGKFENSKHFPMLVEWARYMVEEVEPGSQIAPAVWISFMDGLWDKAGVPTPAYMFNLKMVKRPNNRGWCRQESQDRYRIQSGIQRWSPEAKDLRDRYEKLRQCCLTARECYSDEIVLRLVAKIFPDGFDDAVQAARIGQVRFQEKINRRVASGDLAIYTETK